MVKVEIVVSPRSPLEGYRAQLLVDGGGVQVANDPKIKNAINLVACMGVPCVRAALVERFGWTDSAINAERLCNRARLNALKLHQPEHPAIDHVRAGGIAYHREHGEAFTSPEYIEFATQEYLDSLELYERVSK